MKFLVLCVFLWLTVLGFSQETLRGEVCVEIEPIYAVHLGVSSPLSASDMNVWALEDAQSAFSAMIYGWTFEYETGERERRITENIDLNPLGEISLEDENLAITDARVQGDLFFMYSDYNLSESQKKRVQAWNSTPSSGVQAVGFGNLQGETGITDRRSIKQAALEDAVKKAIRAKLRKTERDRPRAARGRIALSKFPLYRMNDGKWACTASFRIIITEIDKFSAY